MAEKQSGTQDSVHARFVRYVYEALHYKKESFEQKWLIWQNTEIEFEESGESQALKNALAVSDSDLPSQFENERLHQAILSLKLKERQVLILRCIQVLPFQQIADRLHLSYKGTAAIYYRAISKIRKRMEVK